MIDEKKFVLSVFQNYAMSTDLCVEESAIDALDLRVVFALSNEQRILPIVSNYLISKNLKTAIVRSGLDLPFFDSVAIAKTRYKILSDALVEILECFSSLKVNAIPRKGIVYTDLFYGGNPVRHISDLDLYVRAPDVNKVKIALESLGYLEGRFDRWSLKQVPLARTEQLKHLLYPTHLPPYVRTTRCDVVPSIKIDIAVDMAWPGSGLDFLDDAVLKPLLKSKSRPQTWFHLVDCGLHLFREAYFHEPTLKRSWRGVNLKKFLDFTRIVRTLTADDTTALAKLFANAHLAEVMAWVGYHAASLVPLDINERLGIRLSGEIGTNEWSKQGGKTANWNGNMEERIFAENTVQIFGETV